MMATTSSEPSISDTAPYPLMQLKIMYWGPGEAGKTTNFEWLKQTFKPFLISKGFSIETTNHRTLWNDSVTFRFDIHNLRLSTIIHVATTTGQERFLSTREYVLQNADGVIFVADSDEMKQHENRRSFEEVVAFTRESGIPILIQLNKRDHPEAISEADFRLDLDLPDMDPEGMHLVYLAQASKGQGVQEIFMDLFEQILRKKLLK